MAELLTGTPREHIERMWPEHLAHLAPEGNKMGQGSIDPDEGVVCNCGVVLGFPRVQDEADYLMAEADQPDTSGVQTGEPDDEPDGYIGDGHGNYQDPDMLEDLEASGTPEPPPQTKPWTVADGPPDEAQNGPYAVGDTVTVAGIEFTKRGESPFPEHNPPGSPPWGETPQGAWMDDHNGDGSPAYVPPPAESKGVMPYRDQDVVPAEDPLSARMVVIDPTQPYTALDVEHQLLDIEARLERGIHFQRYWEEREFAAESAYTQKAARARLADASGAKDIRDARVQVACEEEWTELLLCRAMVRAVRETMHTLRSLQSGYQTVSRSVTESMRQPATSRRHA